MGRKSQLRLERITEDALNDTQEAVGAGGWPDVQRLWFGYLGIHARKIVGIFCILVAWASVPYFFAMTHMALIDRVLAPDAQGLLVASTREKALIYGLLLIFGLNMLLHTGNLLGHLVTSRLTLRIGQSVSLKLRERIYSRLDELQLTYFDHTQSGRIIARIQNDVDNIQNTIVGHISPLLIDPIKLICGMGFLFFLNWRLALVLAIAAPIYGGVFMLLRPHIRRVSKAQNRLISRLYGLSSERLAAYSVFKAFGTERAELGRFARMVHDGTRLAQRQAYYNQGLSFLAGSISTVVSGTILWVGLRSVEHGLYGMTLGSVVAFVQLTDQVFGPIQSLTSTGAVLQGALVSLRRVLSLLDSPYTQAKGALKLDGMQGKIRFEDVSFSYEGLVRPALANLSFNVRAGEQVAIVGPSGAGKSTLFNLILRFYTPGEGSISVGGVNLEDADTVSLRQHVRYVQQVPFMFSGTIAQNISYGAPSASDDDIIRAAKAVEMHDFVSTLPNGYDTIIGENGVGLSGGQRQRLGLATALLTKPEILLLDDPTSALDAETESRIWETLQHILGTRTSLIITQRISIARRCNRILVLEDGRLTQQGTHEALANAEGFYRRICVEQDALPTRP